MKTEQEIRDKIARLEKTFFITRDGDQDINLMRMLVDEIITLRWVLGECE